MKKMLILERCIDCPMVDSPIGIKCICVPERKYIEDTNTIPDWCPLPSVVDGQEKEDETK